MRGKFEDITGQTFGRLTALERVENDRNKNTQFRFRCLCGNEVVALSGNVRTGKTKSCGCLQAENYENHRIEPGKASFNRVINQYKNNARIKNLEWSLSRELIEEVMTGLCFYCGTPPKREESGPNGSFVYNGLDRIDSSRGYIPSNVVPCCWNCNRMKGDMAFGEFLNHVYEIAGYRPPRYIYTTALADSANVTL